MMDRAAEAARRSERCIARGAHVHQRRRTRTLLSAHLGPMAGALPLRPAPPEGREQRFEARGASGALDIHVYPASEREVARREEAGLTLGSAVGLAPALVFAGGAGDSASPTAGWSRARGW